MTDLQELRKELSYDLCNWKEYSNRQLMQDMLEIVNYIQEKERPNDNLRAAWEAGFALCSSYGDNKHHFCGEQKETQWKKFLKSITNNQ